MQHEPGHREPSLVVDTSHLPPAQCEFIVISDTHYLLRAELQGTEWASIRQFPRRAERALQLAGAMQPDFAVHLGDVTHEYPETGESAKARQGALAQFQRAGLRPYQAAGNMDIGDKPDPTSPAEWVTASTLSAWHEMFGPSWHSFDEHGLHGIVLNTQIMNGPLPAADEQRRWFEEDLRAHRGKRIFLFLHMPPFFVDETEHATGFYNSLDEPARSWLLDLIRTHHVEMVFAGHTHFVALNHINGTRFFIAPSTTTSRAGMPEAFTVRPEDQGRSDEDKLGFYFVRVFADGASVHLIRTGHDAPALDPSDPRRLVIPGTTRDLPASRLGIFASHPLGHMTPGPVIWPSVVRQRVRNDWPLMACLEMGARHLRVPASDLDDASERSRLAVLRREGMTITPYWLWTSHCDVSAAVQEHRSQLDAVEIMVPGSPQPAPTCLEEIKRLRSQAVDVSLSTAIRAVAAPGQYHKRTRVGYRPDELPELDAWLDRHDCAVDRVLCRLYAADPLWETVRTLADQRPLTRIGALDCIVDLPDEDAATHANLSAEGLFAVAAVPGVRLILSPLLDMDRSMDVYFGLLDRLANPRPAFKAARTLTTVLFADDRRYRPGEAPALVGGRSLALTDGSQHFWLLLPDRASETLALAAPLPDDLQNRQLTCYDLIEGTSEQVSGGDGLAAALSRVQGPALVATR